MLLEKSTHLCCRALLCSIGELLADKLDSNSVVSSLLEGLGSPTLLCVAGSRMFFNLKEAAEHGVNVGTNWSSYSHSAIQFDEPQDAGPPSEYVSRTLCYL